MKIGGKYNWINQDEKLIYLGKERCWNRFALVEYPEIVWCEVLDCHLRYIEETPLSECAATCACLFASSLRLRV